VIVASPTVYQVNISNNRSHTVHLNSARSIWQSRKSQLGSFEVSYTCNYPEDHFLLCKHAIAVLREAGETWYSVSTYQNTYSFPIEPIRLKDFKDIQLYITDDEYRNNNPFAEQIELKAKAPKLAQLRGRPKKIRIRKTTEERPNKK
jgi:hypothetical protein